MKSIELTRGKVALIDDEDYNYVLSFGHWYAGDRYAQHHQREDGKEATLLMHVLIWDRHFMRQTTDLIIDHIDRNGFNNQKNNFRLTTNAQNSVNCSKRPNYTGYRGVRFDKRRGNYQALIRVDYHLKHIGMFLDPIDAAFAYDICARKIFGDLATVNGVAHRPGVETVIDENMKIKQFFTSDRHGIYPKQSPITV
jgi:hypothetical protein